MNAFDKVIQDYGLHAENSQGDRAWLYSICKLGSSTYSGGDTFTNNAVKESIRRLEVANVGQHTLAKVRQMLNPLSDRYEMGR